MLFQPDLFSISRPGWVKLDATIAPALDTVLSFLPKALLPLCSDPEQSDALGINSSNFRLTTPQGVFVLKRWSPQGNTSDVTKTLAIMTWLASRQLPVPAPVQFQSGEVLLSIECGAWSLFPYIEGEYFSGAEGELFAAAEVTGRLMETLSRFPPACLPASGPVQMTAADGELLRRVKDASQEWDKLFGLEHASLLAESWPALMSEWEKLDAASPLAGPVQAAHFDLHPHNLLVMGDKVAAVLDFEACKLMPVGYALGFAALKQCRQAITLRQLPGDSRFVGALYAEHLVGSYPGARSLVTQLGDLAVSEVLRRICIILRLNIESGEKKWNRVLTVQLGHLGEARALFG